MDSYLLPSNPSLEIYPEDTCPVEKIHTDNIIHWNIICSCKIGEITKISKCTLVE